MSEYYHLIWHAGKILDKFYEHTNEITAIDFDGSNICSGGADGLVNYYHLANSAAPKSSPG